MSRDNNQRAIGKVISVTADLLVVEMHFGTDNFTVVGFDDVHYVARLGSFVMIPVQSQYVVAEIVGLKETSKLSSARMGAQASEAASPKYLDVVPLGMLPQDPQGKFKFGVSIFPTLYGDVLYALDSELDRIFETDRAFESVIDEDMEGDETTERISESSSTATLESAKTRQRALTIGQSVVFDGYEVKVRIDDFFGGHAAVLGNTGSGKSCTVAAILQSLFTKPGEYAARGATFILFDVNGEYHRALKELAAPEVISVAHHVVDGTSDPNLLTLPHWFLVQSEWELLLQASERTQVPILRTSLGLVSLFASARSEDLNELKNHILATCISHILLGEAGSPSKHDRIVSLLNRFNTPEICIAAIHPYIHINFGQMANAVGLCDYLNGTNDNPSFILHGLTIPSYDNTPFEFSDLNQALDLALVYEEAHGNRSIRDYCASMLTRMKSLEERGDYAFMRGSVANPDHQLTEHEFLLKLFGVRELSSVQFKQSQIVIINLNAVEDEIVEIISSVIARMIFGVLRSASPRSRFPVHLLLEEAHRYISAFPTRTSVESNKVFERIAKEGRKYGLFLIVASQRPSELSKTVLSQCSNFVIHRIQNPDDLYQIRQMTPFISDSVLRRLPSLPKQHALVFGTAVNIPTTFQVRTASPLPESDDAKIREIWYHGPNRPIQIRLTPRRPRVAIRPVSGEVPEDDIDF